jgi:hypothetical protein
MDARLPIYARLLRVSLGFGVFLLALGIWWRMFLWTPADQRRFDTDQAWFLIAFVGPGLCVALGILFQTMYRLIWLAVPVLLAGAGAAYWGVVALFLFDFTGHSSLLPMGYVYLLFVLVAVVTSLADAIIKLAHRSSGTMSNKSLDRSHGKRLSHQA